MSMGQRLQRARFIAGLTQLDVAELLRERGGLNYTRTAITRWEKGSRKVPPEAVTPLADILDIDALTLVGCTCPTSSEVGLVPLDALTLYASVILDGIRLHPAERWAVMHEAQLVAYLVPPDHDSVHAH